MNYRGVEPWEGVRDGSCLSLYLMIVLPNQIHPSKLNGASHELVYESCQ